MKLVKILLVLVIGLTLPISCTIGDADDDDDWGFGGDEAIEDGGASGKSASAGKGGKNTGGGSGGNTAGASGKTTADGGKAGAAGISGSGAIGGSAGTAGTSAAAGAGGAAGYSGLTPVVEDVPYGLGAAICLALEDCRGQGAEVVRYNLNGENCSEQTGAALANRDLASLQDSVGSQPSRVVFRPEMLEQCLKDIRALGCTVYNSRRPASCKQALEGKVALSGKCLIDEECAGAAFCDRGTEWAVCPGTCKELLPEGLDCRVSDNCKEGLTCNGGKCRAFLNENAPCASNSSLCQPGLTCIENQKVCVAVTDIWIKAEGVACDPAPTNDDIPTMCQVGGAEPLSCVRQASGSANAAVCQKRAQAGGKCRGALPSQCPSGQYCNALLGEEGDCVNLPGQGETCRSGTSGKTQRCAVGMQCEEDGKCYPINPNFYGCTVNSGCFSGICASDGKCEPPPVCAL